jgi:hypothetical protein
MFNNYNPLLGPFVYAFICSFFVSWQHLFVLMQVYACLVPVLEQQAVEEGFTVIHGEELMLDINTGTEKYSLHIFLHVLLKSCF